MKNTNYNCFSYNQMKFLVKNGTEPIHVMVHSRTKNTFWIFKGSDRLSELLNIWSEKKNVNVASQSSNK